jgi:hypothetical protein
LSIYFKLLLEILPYIDNSEKQSQPNTSTFFEIALFCMTVVSTGMLLGYWSPISSSHGYLLERL